MRRRDFLKTTGTILAAATVAKPALSAAPEATPAQGRTILPINRNWRYSRTFTEGATAPGFNDSTFERVVIPHTNIALPWHSFDDKLYEFVSVYRRRFKLPASAHGKRVFVDFEGVMTASKVWINGTLLGEYKGGFTPFSFELTDHVHLDAENVLAVQVDSTERADIPPFGYQIDYLTFGGIYREVSLRLVPQTFLENIFARPKDVLTDSPSVDVQCFLIHSAEHGAASSSNLTLEVTLKDGDKILGNATKPVETGATGPDPAPTMVTLSGFGKPNLWDLKNPNLYTVHVQLMQNGHTVDEDTRRIGFREATFTDHGFSLNGTVVKLRGLDRHQTFPWVGQAMPARVQRQDAIILRKKLHCNLVRTSHYPQSRHFLDCCDEIGLLVLEEIPGWQHIGPQPWKDISVDNVSRMIRRDWNHPSIILWGVRINESQDDHDFYTRTNAMAHSLDSSRQTGGIRYFQESEFLEDVFTMNDFGFPLKAPNHPRYLNTEFVGHTFPTKTIDGVERRTEHALRHARIHDQLASNPEYAGGIGWCAFDYNTHSDFGSGDRICYHGVTDIFREPKAAAMFYKSQCDPDEEIVLEPAFAWAGGDQSVGFSNAVVFSNCDHIKFYVKDKLVLEADPDRKQFQHLKYAPFVADMGKSTDPWGDLRIEGYIQGKQVISSSYSGRGVDQKFTLLPDDLNLIADGADTTRVVLRVTDEFEAIRPFANDPIQFEIEGPAVLIGDNPFAVVGGQGAIWIRAKEQAGTVHLRAKHPVLGTQHLTLTLTASKPELA
jgi:beta-galactosidase